ncbi:hypothetical protein CHLRE_15g644050v5 [Chlamydomonas reinhardtii]|uniref:Fibronectin type-II domain-containing protein n=1 Tax=Chlamydomonas reinhardtii TaxID=3055 RepID=A0A2K3CWX6_CHLRE|nr:uncharacterized protein CHLRE_15g644050v5 [Chlamydomonas reinhardtii]PNW72794.1 hypothetical protein CHLRE_15g644050v5 [Chlamydomonas reinhardtii]
MLCFADLSHHLGLVHTFTEGSCGYDADQPTGVSDTPSASGPVWSMPWSLNAYKASVRLGIPPGDQTPGFDSCPDRPGSDETANYITYSYPICYVWKSGGTTYSDCVTTPGGQDARGPWCAVDKSDGNCVGPRNGWWDTCVPACGGSSNSGGGSSSSSSGGGSGSSSGGSSGSSGGGGGGGSSGGGGGSGSGGSGSGSSSGGGSSSSGAKPSCGPGAATKSGLTCTSKAWTIKGSSATYTGCANPTNDPKGVWCALAKGQATATGTSWDYCPDACNPTTTTTGGTSSGAGGSSSGPAPSPAAAPSYPLRKDCGARAVTGLPTGCSCADSYNIGFDEFGTSYAKQRGCTSFIETQGRGICITTCTAGNKAANRKPYACDCAAA